MLRLKLESGQIVEERTVFTRAQEAREADDRSDLSGEDIESRPVRSRKSKRARFDDNKVDDALQDKDTPPTRSRSRKGRSRVAFDEGRS